MCKKYDIIIDMMCEDCGMLICFKCVEMDYMDYNLNIIIILVSLRRWEFREYLLKIIKEGIG